MLSVGHYHFLIAVYCALDPGCFCFLYKTPLATTTPCVCIANVARYPPQILPLTLSQSCLILPAFLYLCFSTFTFLFSLFYYEPNTNSWSDIAFFVILIYYNSWVPFPPTMTCVHFHKPI